MIVLQRLVKSTTAKSSQNLLMATFVRTHFSIKDIGKRYPKVYDYKNRPYRAWGQLTDDTAKRLSDNSLIITVDGNFGSGKTKFARDLAKELDFHYARDIDFESMLYKTKVNTNGREIMNAIVGDKEMYRWSSLDEWHQAPSFKRTAEMQFKFYYCRWQQYRTALVHLLSTGQGVVLERSPFTDIAIAESLYENNWLSKEAWNYYKNDFVKQTICELWKPHVSIYLDRSVDKCIKNVQPADSPIYTKEFLQSVEKNYRKNYLEKYANELYILHYDANDEVVCEDVLGDLENIDLDNPQRLDDWYIRRLMHLNAFRSKMCNNVWAENLFSKSMGFVRVPEMLLYGEELVKLQEIDSQYPDFKPDAGRSVFQQVFDKFVPKKQIPDWI